jgi:hypothetical protein
MHQQSTTVVCPACQSPFRAFASNLRRGRGKFCSRICANTSPLQAGNAHWASIDLEEKFWAQVTKTETCWLWTGTKNGGGYGVFTPHKRFTTTHRYSYELKHGAIPDGLAVCHSCDVPSCVNPDHLWLGTGKDNMDDMRTKGRGRGKKLGIADIERIRQRSANGEALDDLAQEYLISVRTVKRYIRNV